MKSTLMGFVLALFFAIPVTAQTLTSKVVDAATREPIVGAAVTLVSATRTVAITDTLGCFALPTSARGQQLRISYLGYKTLTRTFTPNTVYTLRPDVNALGEVVVTARASDGPVTSSIIGRDAMRHLQPNSIADLMELLPGGYAKDPNMGQANTITLRETGTMGA